MMERSTSKITLAESVYERIRRDIITNQLKPGEKINIRELSTRYEASETPIRLALNRLPLRISSSISPARECGSNR